MIFSTTQAETVADLLERVAQAEILPRFRRLEAGDIRTKTGPLDLVTEADEAAERVITAELLRLFPGCVVVGEEACEADPGLLDHLPDARLAFVVDPIDGTANYASGLPLFGSMIAAISHGETIAGIIHDPIGHDTALAVRGEGAWMRATDGTRRDLRAAAPAAVADMAGAASWRYLPPGQREQVCANLVRVAASHSFRCAAHEYRLLADGHLDYLRYGRMKPWDNAPGVLLHSEAGGYAARFDGTAYSPLLIQGGLICAPDRESWQALRAGLLDA